jgi:hypothetical protein
MKKLKNVGNVLSRNEMRNIYAGLADGSEFGIDASLCKSSKCSLYVHSLGKTVQGTCGTQSHFGGGLGSNVCKCFSDDGNYETGNGGTACYA